MRASRRLVKYLCKFNGLDVSRFEDPTVWPIEQVELAEMVYAGFMTDAEVERLEILCAKIPA